MRIAYLECFSGVSGDMLLGALVHAGVSANLLYDTLERLNMGLKLQVTDVERCGVHAIKIDVTTPRGIVEPLPEMIEPDNLPALPESSPRRNQAALPALAVTSESHSHNSPKSDQSHGRSLHSIRRLIEKADIPPEAKELAIKTFELLGAAEAKIHNLPVESVHFHEIGALDAIADIVLASVAARSLNVDQWICSPLNVGGGMVRCAHGAYPVPAPATAELLKGAPAYSSGVSAELVTPTGAALVRALGCSFSKSAPAMRTAEIGYGAGSRNPAEFPNVVRLSIGTSEPHEQLETVTVLETAVDDLSPQVIAFFAERALVLGALDVMCLPVAMKKGRLGTLITILSRPSDAELFEAFLFRETSTLGVRRREDRRIVLERKRVLVRTPWGQVHVKAGFLRGEEVNVAPEFDECRQLAESKGIPMKRVLEAALQAYRQGEV